MLNVKIYMYNFCIKIFHSIQNYVDNGKNHLHQKVVNMYVCLNVKPLKRCMYFSYSAKQLFPHFSGYIHVT